MRKIQEEKKERRYAASDLGPSRKGSPCLRDIASGQTVTLAEIEGPGAINHIWITVDAKPQTQIALY